MHSLMSRMPAGVKHAFPPDTCVAGGQEVAAVWPEECRPVISQPILEAAVALAICWGWFDWAALTLIGFLCVLHPSEMVPLVCQDIVLPEDAVSSDCIAYVQIRSPKTQRFARWQRCRLEDFLTLRLLTSLYFSLPFNARLFSWFPSYL